MAGLSRNEIFKKIFPDQPSYRLRQMTEALFHDGWRSWADATSLPLAVREKLAAEVPWISVVDSDVHAAADRNTFKAILALADDNRIETVLMTNRRGQWTICVSSQVGCAMKCAFCATGRMGLKRNLTADEIIDQVRFWREYLEREASSDEPKNIEKIRNLTEAHSSKLEARISNIVFMGMGEPLANYDNVKTAIKTVLEHTDIGPTRITVSTAGILPQLDILNEDPDWPDVRLAVSLHSADAKTRRELMPVSHEKFLDGLQDWCVRYLRRHGDRRHHLTFEHVMLGGINDTPAHAEKLAEFVNAIGKVKVNLIPFNWTDTGFRGSADDAVNRFVSILEAAGVTVTVRRSLGQDIDAACGQLASKK